MQLFWENRRGAAPVTATLSLLAACMLLCLVLSPPAGAVTGRWFLGVLPPQGEKAQSTVYNLRISAAYGQDWVGAAAHIPGGWTLYGSYITGWLRACHSYAAGNSLGSMAKNDSGLYDQAIEGGYSTDYPC